MLDLVAVAGQLRTMRTGLDSYAQELTPRLAQTLAAWDRAGAMGAELRDRVARAKTSWLVAEPLEPLGAHAIRPAGNYRVVASDGSQILPDRHERMPCHLVNTGVVDIDYATGRVDLGSKPEVFWRPEDTYPLFGGTRQEADGRVVGARRFAAECDALREAISRATDSETVALVDGTLLLWWLEPDPLRLRSLEDADVKARALRALDDLVRQTQEGGTLLAAYGSSPRTTDVVAMLKVVLCTEDPVDCDHCPYASGAKAWHAQLEIAGASLLPVPSKPCEEADPITDAAVFWSILEPGQRSSRFRSASRVTGAYRTPIDFCYLHTGDEIARLEFPASTAPGGLERLCAAVADQSAKGLGYPVALSEAHERAVVRAADRRAFEELVRRQGVSRPTAKLRRKRVSVL